jgi:hypothetical protein
MFELTGNQGRLQVSRSTARSAGTTAHAVSAENKSCPVALPRQYRSPSRSGTTTPTTGPLPLWLEKLVVKSFSLSGIWAEVDR